MLTAFAVKIEIRREIRHSSDVPCAHKCNLASCFLMQQLAVQFQHCLILVFRKIFFILSFVCCRWRIRLPDSWPFWAAHPQISPGVVVRAASSFQHTSRYTVTMLEIQSESDAKRKARFCFKSRLFKPLFFCIPAFRAGSVSSA